MKRNRLITKIARHFRKRCFQIIHPKTQHQRSLRNKKSRRRIDQIILQGDKQPPSSNLQNRQRPSRNQSRQRSKQISKTNWKKHPKIIRKWIHSPPNQRRTQPTPKLIN